MSVSEQLSGISTSWVTMAELQEGNSSFVLPISSAERIWLLRWWRDLWSFGALSFSLMSHDSHYFFYSGRVWVWRLRSQEFDLKGLQLTVKHEDINSGKYVSILKEGLVPICSSGRRVKMTSYLWKMELLVKVLKQHKNG